MEKEDDVAKTSTENGHAKEEAVNQNGGDNKQSEEAEEDPAEAEPELYFTPKVNLPLVDVNSMEDNEDVVVEL